MRTTHRWLMMTTAAALCAAPLLAFGQATTGTASGTMPPAATQARPQAGSVPDGAPGNPPSTATQRALDSVTGQRTSPDGTGNNPPGTAVGRALDRAADAVSDATTPDRTAPASRATHGGTAAVAADSARLQDGRRATKMIGANVYNEQNESIGEVEDLILTLNGAQRPVAIISVGGFLGIGARLVAVPTERLQWNAERERWLLTGATKDSLKSMAPFSYEERGRRG